MHVFFLLGREPEISVAEIRAVYGARLGATFQPHSSLLVAEMEVFDAREAAATLGGSVKYGRMQLISGGREQLVASIANVVLEDNFQKRALSPERTSKKVLFAVNSYLDQGKDKTFSGKILGFEVKSLLEREGHSARMATSGEETMSAAAVAKAQLLDRGTDVIVAEHEGVVWLGVTEAVQPFEAQSIRDYERPARDARRGMLPVQLARVLVNLAGGRAVKSLLDPFCGVGTVLMEAALLQIPTIVGADIDHKAIEATEKNIAWLRAASKKVPIISSIHGVTRDARKTPPAPQYDAIVAEPFLGAPVEQLLPKSEIEKRWAALTPMYRESFQALAATLAAGGRFVVTLPAYKSGKIFLPFPKEGLFPTSFQADITGTPLLYRRADQFVGREIVVLQKA